jgi:hypothetical protein
MPVPMGELSLQPIILSLRGVSIPDHVAEADLGVVVSLQVLCGMTCSHGMLKVFAQYLLFL